MPASLAAAHPHRASEPRRAPARKPPASTVAGAVGAERPGPVATHGSSSGAGRAAHRRVSAVSAESDAGTVPVIALSQKFLRSPPPHGRR